ncbi:MAG: hypothetical protein JW955_24850 [Sedimentisphaerales bacterium]|nr:hypothetical protein [Sedimentisphaerales bacterium]
MRRIVLQALLAATTCLLGTYSATLAAQRTIRVDDDGPADFDTIQAAIDAADDRDTIIVAEGLYIENARIDGKNIRLRSTRPNDPNIVAATIIDGSFRGPVVTFSGAESKTCLLRGFTLQNGSAPQGGGICGNGTAATIRDNVIRDNVAIHAYPLAREDILWNPMPAADFGDGGGLFGCHGVIRDNTIVQNISIRGGGLSYCDGTISDNTVTENTALDFGGGLSECCGPIERNIVSRNVAGLHGGGLSECDGTVRNNLIVDNTAAGGVGGGLHHCGGRVENNTVVGNQAFIAGGGLSYCDARVVNCIIWENRPSQIEFASDVSFCDVQGGYPGNGNLDEAPGFVRASHWDDNGTPTNPDDDFWVDGDYHLPSQAWRLDPVDGNWVRDAVTSPCVDTGDPNSLVGDEPFPHGERINMGAYGGTPEAARSYFGELGYAGGSGTEADPFMLCVPQHLVTLTGSMAQWDKSFRLHDDIDVTDWPNEIGPIGNRDVAFSGTLDGNEQRIVGLTIVSSTDRCVGLMGRVHKGRIMRVRLVAPFIDAEQAFWVGALVGTLGDGEVSDCHVEQASVWGSWSVGGLVGLNSDLVTRSSSTGDVCGQSSVGGLVGHNVKSITDCFSTARAYATKSFPAYAKAGGLVGCNDNDGIIRDCYATGEVLAERAVGGLVGYNRSYVAYCYATGIVLGGEDVGGLIGCMDSGSVYASYWDKQTSWRWVSAGGIGKTTAELQSLATFVEWPDTESWTLDEGVDYPRLAWENAGGETLAGLDPLASFVGAGTRDAPYLIQTAEDLDTVAAFPSQWDKHFKLAADIDLSGFTAAPIRTLGNGFTPFSGTFDGAGYIIQGLDYAAESTSYLALFGIVNGPDATIQNLTLVDPKVKGRSCVAALVGCLQQGDIVNCTVRSASISGESDAGGLVGRNAGRITMCQAQGAVTAEFARAGGLVGFSEGSITQCLATGSGRGTEPRDPLKLTGSSDVGGLAGYNMGRIDNCFARCSVHAVYESGGLVGYNSGAIEYCYSSGQVTGSQLGGFCGNNSRGTVTACFWDAQRYDCANSDGGVGKTIAELKQAATFLDAGWDFVGETANGTEDIWTISEGIDYPRFVWEFASDEQQ